MHLEEEKSNEQDTFEKNYVIEFLIINMRFQHAGVATFCIIIASTGVLVMRIILLYGLFAHNT